MELKKCSAIPQLKELVAQVNKDNSFLTVQNDEIITLFVSLDIVNSTLYKSLYKEDWSTAFSNILRRIISVFSNNPTGGYDFWKTLGDEIIYTRKIGNVQDLLDTLDEVYRSLIFLNQKIAQGELCDSNSAQILSLKATAWLADLSSSHEKTNNILTYYQINDKRRQADYIGPDIDAGFRTAHYSTSNRMVISFEIACILMRYHHQLQGDPKQRALDMSNRIHLLTQKVLKGVWDGHPYPILFYHGNSKFSFTDSLTPQEKGMPGVLQEYWDARFVRETALQPGYLCYQEQELERMCRELNLDDKIQHLIALMERTGRVSTLDVKNLRRINCTAVCYQIQDGTLRCMVVQNRKTGLWGFGVVSFLIATNSWGKQSTYTNWCSDLSYSDQFAQRAEQFYKDEFGVDISMDYDIHHYTPIPVVVPVTQFTPDKSAYINRTVFLGRLNQHPPLEETKACAHIKLLTLDELANLQGECIPLFHEILSQCVSKIQATELEKNVTRLPYKLGGVSL